MPNFPAIGDAPRVDRREFSLTFLDHDGFPGNSFISVPSTSTNVELDALRTALGDGSNAALYESRYTNSSRVLNHTNLEAYDETYPSSEDVAVFQFIDDTGDVQSLELPAPDSTLFYTTDRKTIDPARALSGAIIAAALAAMNNGGGTYVYSRGYKTTHRKTRGGANARKRPAFVEPGAGDTPGGADGA